MGALDQFEPTKYISSISESMQRSSELNIRDPLQNSKVLF